VADTLGPDRDTDKDHRHKPRLATPGAIDEREGI